VDNTTQILKLRREKLQKIIDRGINPYPVKSLRTHKIKELWDNKDKFIAENTVVTIVGRLVAMRRQGKIGFGNVADISEKIQIFVKKDDLGDENYELFKLCDMGDFVQVTGTAFITQTGEYSVKASNIKLLTKNLRPTPVVKEKEVDGKLLRYDEFSDIELRYRKRYLDLLLNPDRKETFIQRSKIIQDIRNYLNSLEFIEVETPILQPLYGGANARPFVTHHNTLDMDLYLRIATELYLKRLIIGGFERVYEIGKNFRNEGMDRTHNPEFTAIELYQAYSDLEGMMDITEGIIQSIAKNVFNKSIFTFNNKEINVGTSFRRASMADLVEEYSGFSAHDLDYDKIATFMNEKKLAIPANVGPGKLLEELFEHFVESKLIQPTFVTDFPTEVSPLAKARTDNPKFVERFELFICGNEYGNAFSELNDPLDQRQRLEDQAKLREMGDDEANVVDEDFLEALEYGMPPMGGLGIGIDRLIMLLTNNSSIKEVILFPTMKPE
jgi:lysyl-tRNA synthetase class 2